VRIPLPETLMGFDFIEIDLLHLIFDLDDSNPITTLSPSMD
jgi:hypothetical protein